MEIEVKKDGDGFLARVREQDNLFAFAYTKDEAISELKSVVEMIMDFHLEQINIERLVKQQLEALQNTNAV